MFGLSGIFGKPVQKPSLHTPWEYEAFTKQHGSAPDVRIKHKGKLYFAHVRLRDLTSQTPILILKNLTRLQRKAHSVEYTTHLVDIVREGAGITPKFRNYLESLKPEILEDLWMLPAREKAEKERKQELYKNLDHN
jgi:hypothetical protein